MSLHSARGRRSGLWEVRSEQFRKSLLTRVKSVWEMRNAYVLVSDCRWEVRLGTGLNGTGLYNFNWTHLAQVRCAVASCLVHADSGSLLTTWANIGFLMRAFLRGVTLISCFVHISFPVSTLTEFRVILKNTRQNVPVMAILAVDFVIINAVVLQTQQLYLMKMRSPALHIVEPAGSTHCTSVHWTPNYIYRQY